MEQYFPEISRLVAPARLDQTVPFSFGGGGGGLGFQKFATELKVMKVYLFAFYYYFWKKKTLWAGRLIDD